jgi:hypothetical protein
MGRRLKVETEEPCPLIKAYLRAHQSQHRILEGPSRACGSPMLCTRGVNEEEKEDEEKEAMASVCSSWAELEAPKALAVTPTYLVTRLSENLPARRATGERDRGVDPLSFI